MSFRTPAAVQPVSLAARNDAALVGLLSSMVRVFFSWHIIFNRCNHGLRGPWQLPVIQ